MAMNRRRYLTTVTAAVGGLGLAGCSSNTDESEGSTRTDTPDSDSTDTATGTALSTATEGSPETATEGSPETATEGSPETATETPPETATETPPETATEPEPQYAMSSRQNLFLSLSAFPDGWVRDDSLNDSFDAVFANSDRSVIVLLAVEIFADVAGAEDRIQRAKAGVSEVNDYDIADDSFWTTTDSLASTLFRDSNAVGQVAAVHEPNSELVPDSERSRQYARDMYEHWKTV